MSEARKAGKDVFVYTIVNIVPLILGFISIPIFTRIFNPSEYGQFSIVQITVNYAAVCALTWVNSSFIRFYESYKKSNREKEMVNNYVLLLLLSSFISVFFYTIFLILASSFGWFNESLLHLFRVGALLLFFTGSLNFIFSYFRAKRESLNFAFATVGNSVFTLVLALVFVLVLGFGVDGIIIGSTIVSAFISVIVVSLIVKKYGFKLRLFNKKMAKEALFYGAPIIFTNFATWILRFSDRYIIEFTRSTSEVGLYAVSYSISEKSILIFVNAVAFAVIPILIYSWEHNGKRKTEDLLRKFSRYQIMFLLPASVGLIILAPQITYYLVGGDFRGGVLSTQIVAIGILFYGLYGLTNIGLYMRKQTLKIAATMLAVGAINIIINIIFIPSFGYIVAAISTAFSYFLLWAVSYFQTKKLLRWGIDGRSLIKIFFSTIVMALFLTLVKGFSNSIWTLLAIAFLTAVVFFLTLLLTGDIKNESQLVIKKIRKIL